MRLLILSVSALSLGACTMGGVGYGAGHSGYEAPTAVGYGAWQGQAAGYGHTPCGYDPCAAASYQAASYQMTPPHVPQAPVVNYPAGYQANYGYAANYTPPAPVHPQPIYPQPGCQPVNPCASTYAVSGNHESSSWGQPYGGYGYGQPQDYGYGQTGPSNMRGPFSLKQGYMYGTVGAVWYDMDRPYAGLQGRLGYQTASILGGRRVGNNDVIGETSPFNQNVGGGTILSGEFKDGIKHSIAGFATARLPLSPTISTHARVGYHSTKTYADVNFDNAPDQDTTFTRDGIAYGVGLQMEMTPVDAVRLDVTRYDDDFDNNDAVSLAYLRRF